MAPTGSEISRTKRWPEAGGHFRSLAACRACKRAEQWERRQRSERWWHDIENWRAGRAHREARWNHLLIPLLLRSSFKESRLSKTWSLPSNLQPVNLLFYKPKPSVSRLSITDVRASSYKGFFLQRKGFHQDPNLARLWKETVSSAFSASIFRLRLPLACWRAVLDVSFFHCKCMAAQFLGNPTTLKRKCFPRRLMTGALRLWKSAF